MEVTYKKDINHTYILFQGETINTETFQVQMMLHNLVEGILPCSIISVDQEDIWRCECTGMQSLDIYCRTRELGKKEFIWIVNQLLENIQELQDFLLNVNNLYLIPENIYIHPEKNRILCCMVPAYHNDVWNSLKQVLQFLLQYLDPQDHEVASLAYGFFRVLSKEDCSMETLWSLLYEKQRNWKNNIHGEVKEGGEKQYERRYKIDERQQDAEERDALLDQLFFSKKEEHKEKTEDNFREKYGNQNFLKKILYLFPAVAAVFLFLYLVFNSWTMSGGTLATFAGAIVVLQVLSLLFYRKWGREVKDVNPLFHGEIDASDELMEENLKYGKRKNHKHKKKRADYTSDEHRKEYLKAGKYDHRKDDSAIWESDFFKERLENEWSDYLKDDSEKWQSDYLNDNSKEWQSEQTKKEEGTVFLDDTPDNKRYLVRTDTGERYELLEKEMIIGKNKDRAQILLTEPTVSRIHAMITKKRDSCYIQDLNSKNGTYINGERLPIRKDVTFQEGDILHIANIQFSMKK